MAQRITTPVDFSSITYDSLNENRRWYVEGLSTITTPTDFSDIAVRAQLVTDLFQSNGAAGSSDKLFNVGGTPTDVTVAVRIPQTKRIMDLILTRTNATAGDFDDNSIEYDVYVSGRSDKMYTEIIDWVKVVDNTDQKPDTDPFGFIPEATKTTGSGDSDSFHARFFPYMTSWIRIVFKNVTDTTDLSLDKFLLHEFVEDNQVTGAVTNPAIEEEAPEIEQVFPKDSSSWLPSQTVMFTSRITSPDYDNCQFGFEIYKESDATPFDGDYTGPSAAEGPHGVFGLNDASQDIMMARFESNALNLDGTTNQWYTNDWTSLPDVRPSVTNSVYFPGVVKNQSGTAPQAVLVVPVEGSVQGATRETTASFTNIKFYKNAGNELKWDTLNGDSGNSGNASLFTSNPITLPGYDTSKEKFSAEDAQAATGWVIEFPSNIEFDRIDFINDSSNIPSRVKLFFITGNPGGGDTADLVNGVWQEAGVFRPEDNVSKVEFCWPQTDVYTDGYLEGTDGELDADPDSYNPDRIGKGIDQTNDGDWTIVPKFAGIMVGDSEDAGINGDSPVQAGENYQTNVPLPTAEGNVIYARVSLPDPYRDGERFYIRGYVWDGRTKKI